MIKGIFIAGRGLDARMKNLESVANNLANLNTIGFKREVPFSEILNQAGDVKVIQNTDYRQGNLIQTSSPLDLAIYGSGFFVVKTNSGEELTRDGRMQISSDGFLVDGQGNKVLGKQGAININSFMLDNNQTITVDKNGQVKVGDHIVDTLLIAQPFDSQDIQRASGGNLTTPGGAKIVDQSGYEIKQGYLEESNVNPLKEMEAMINLSTQYQSTQKVVNTLDQSLNEANQIGKV
jgi:flagellar basal-body rod protein FlgF